MGDETLITLLGEIPKWVSGISICGNDLLNLKLANCNLWKKWFWRQRSGRLVYINKVYWHKVPVRTNFLNIMSIYISKMCDVIDYQVFKICMRYCPLCFYFFRTFVQRSNLHAWRHVFVLLLLYCRAKIAMLKIIIYAWV